MNRNMRTSTWLVVLFVAAFVFGVSTKAQAETTAEQLESDFASMMATEQCSSLYETLFGYLHDPGEYDTQFEKRRVLPLLEVAKKKARGTVFTCKTQVTFAVDDYSFKAKAFKVSLDRINEASESLRVSVSDPAMMKSISLKAKESEAEEFQTKTILTGQIWFKPLHLGTKVDKPCFGSMLECSHDVLNIKALAIRITDQEGNVVLERGKVPE